MARFQGIASAKVDDKGRLVLPSTFRDTIVRDGNTDMTLIIKKSVHGDCLDLYTLKEWERRSDLILETIDPELNPQHAAFWATYNDEVYTVIPDGKIGRLNIPESLLKAAGITKEVVFAGVGYKIQIWDKARRNESLLPADQFKKAASEISARAK